MTERLRGKGSFITLALLCLFVAVLSTVLLHHLGESLKNQHRIAVQQERITQALLLLKATDAKVKQNTDEIDGLLKDDKRLRDLLAELGVDPGPAPSTSSGPVPVPTLGPTRVPNSSHRGNTFVRPTPAPSPSPRATRSPRPRPTPAPSPSPSPRPSIVCVLGVCL